MSNRQMSATTHLADVTACFKGLQPADLRQGRLRANDICRGYMTLGLCQAEDTSTETGNGRWAPAAARPSRSPVSGGRLSPLSPLTPGPSAHRLVVAAEDSEADCPSRPLVVRSTKMQCSPASARPPTSLGRSEVSPSFAADPCVSPHSSTASRCASSLSSSLSAAF